MLELLNGGRWREWVPIPIRMILGVGFTVHGWAKRNRGPAAFAELLKQAHVPLPLANAWLVTLPTAAPFASSRLTRRNEEIDQRQL
jgi:uncharacterized membrane protein YphA (DoxX/SURF4 family)